MLSWLLVYSWSKSSHRPMIVTWACWVHNWNDYGVRETFNWLTHVYVIWLKTVELYGVKIVWFYKVGVGCFLLTMIVWLTDSEAQGQSHEAMKNLANSMGILAGQLNRQLYGRAVGVVSLDIAPKRYGVEITLLRFLVWWISILFQCITEFPKIHDQQLKTMYLLYELI